MKQMEALRERVEFFMEALEISRAALAEQSGLSISAINYILKQGGQRTTVMSLIKLSEAFTKLTGRKVTTDCLIGEGKIDYKKCSECGSITWK